MSSKAQPAALPPALDSLAPSRRMTLDTVSALTEANQRVAGKLIELSSQAARDSLQAYVDMQAAALDALRSMPAPTWPTQEAIDELRQDPLAWYRQGLLGAAGATQRMARLFETNAKILVRGAERFESSAEEAAREIGDAVKTCVSRIKEIQASR
jgi:hypothetical protein